MIFSIAGLIETCKLIVEADANVNAADLGNLIKYHIFWIFSVKKKFSKKKFKQKIWQTIFFVQFITYNSLTFNFSILFDLDGWTALHVAVADSMGKFIFVLLLILILIIIFDS